MKEIRRIGKFDRPNHLKSAVYSKSILLEQEHCSGLLRVPVSVFGHQKLFDFRSKTTSSAAICIRIDLAKKSHNATHNTLNKKGETQIPQKCTCIQGTNTHMDTCMHGRMDG